MHNAGLVNDESCPAELAAGLFFLYQSKFRFEYLSSSFSIHNMSGVKGPIFLNISSLYRTEQKPGKSVR